MAEYLDLADYLLIAEEVLGVPAERIAGWPRIGLAGSALNAPATGFGGVEFYPDLFDKAAVLCVRLARNHPLPDGDKRVAYLALVECFGRSAGSRLHSEASSKAQARQEGRRIRGAFRRRSR